MQGTDRKLVNPPFTLREYAEQRAAERAAAAAARPSGIDYTLVVQTPDSVLHREVNVQAPDINNGFAFAAIKALAGLVPGEEIVSLTFSIRHG